MALLRTPPIGYLPCNRVLPLKRVFEMRRIFFRIFRRKIKKKLSLGFWGLGYWGFGVLVIGVLGLLVWPIFLIGKDRDISQRKPFFLKKFFFSGGVRASLK